MVHEIVHMIGDENGAEIATGEVPMVRTRCGRSITRPVVDGVPTRYELVAENGNIFHCTTRTRFVSCVKCNNILGASNARPSRPAVAAQ